MYQTLHNNGSIILTVPQHPFLWSQADNHAHYLRRHGAQENQSGCWIQSNKNDILWITTIITYAPLSLAAATT